MEDIFEQYPLLASRPFVAKAVITAVLVLNIALCWFIKLDPNPWAPPNVFGTIPLLVCALALGWLHTRPALTGARPAVVIGWTIGLLVLAGSFLTSALSYSHPASAGNKGLAVFIMFTMGFAQLLIPIADRWGRNADETLLAASTDVLKFLGIGAVVCVVFWLS